MILPGLYTDTSLRTIRNVFYAEYLPENRAPIPVMTAKS
jgi:hypothetical protein